MPDAANVNTKKKQIYDRQQKYTTDEKKLYVMKKNKTFFLTHNRKEKPNSEHDIVFVLLYIISRTNLKRKNF